MTTTSQAQYSKLRVNAPARF